MKASIEPRPKAVAAFDVDDVFWPLNEHVAPIAGVDYNDIVTFHTMDNPKLTMAQKKRLYAAYQTPRLHERMDFYPGAREFGILARDPRLEPWICSNSLDQAVIDDKARNLSEFLGPDWSLFHKMFGTTTMDNSREKKFPPGLWLLFDDSPLNAVASNAEHVLMPVRPWSVSGWAKDVMSGIMDRVAYYSCPAEACEMARRLLDAEFGPL